MVRETNVLKLATNLFRLRTKFSVVDGISEIYKPSIDTLKEELCKKVTDVSNGFSKSEIARKLRIAKGFYTLEMAPPQSGEIQKMREDFKLLQEFFKTGSYKHLTVKQAWLLILVGTEIGLWFFLGETIGKMHIVGYKV